MKVVERKLTEITVGERSRTDFGDMVDLMKSMDRDGLFNAIIVDEAGSLVCGARRLEAARRLSWSTIECKVVDTATDALRALRMERDENQCRKPFTASEAVAMAKRIRELEAPKAKERQRHHGGTAPGKKKNSSSKLDEVFAGARTDQQIADAVGYGRTSLRKAETVVDAAEENPDDTELQEAVEEMDRTGKVDPAYKRVRAKQGKPVAKSKPKAPPKPEKDSLPEHARLPFSEQIAMLRKYVYQVAAYWPPDQVDGLSSCLKNLSEEVYGYAGVELDD